MEVLALSAPSYSIEQVAAHYGKSRKTIERYVDAGLLTPFRLGKSLRFDATELPKEINLTTTTKKTQ